MYNQNLKKLQKLKSPEEYSSFSNTSFLTKPVQHKTAKTFILKNTEKMKDTFWYEKIVHFTAYKKATVQSKL